MIIIAIVIIIIIITIMIMIIKVISTVRPLLSGHPRDFEKWPLNRDWPLNRGTI